MDEAAVGVKDTNHEKINGQDYKNLIISAAYQLEKSKEEINDLNVFPVPDGDTGSNMSLTVGNAARELLNDESRGVSETAEKTAKAMLRGARGNSGVIISLLFRGIAKGLKNSFECDGVAWANALNEGILAAYSAVEHPADGTILTVAKRSAEAAKQASLEKNDFEYVLGVAIEAAEKALEETVYENPVLERAGVVDAGGMGWLVVMRAMRRALNGEGKETVLVPYKDEKNAFSAYKSEDITFAFCTELIVKKQGDANAENFKSYLSRMGDSLVFVDDGEIIKVHIHTNEPHAVLGEALRYGEYETVKVENMRTQHTEKIGKSAPKNKKYGIVSVSSGEGLKELFLELGADAVVSGGQTMNPSCQEIFEATEGVLADTVFLLPNNKNIVMACEQVAGMSQKNIVVIPTKTVPQGISAMIGFDEGADREENITKMCEMARGVSTIQITYAVKTTVLEGVEIKAGEYLALYEKEILASGHSLEGVIYKVCEKIKEAGKQNVSIYYGCDVKSEDANAFTRQMEGILTDSGAEINLYNGGQPVYYYLISLE